jgi:hypothetical protein
MDGKMNAQFNCTLAYEFYVCRLKERSVVSSSKMHHTPVEHYPEQFSLNR